MFLQGWCWWQVQHAHGCDGTGILLLVVDHTVGTNAAFTEHLSAAVLGLQGLWTEGEAGGQRLQAQTTCLSVPSQSLRFGRGTEPPGPRVLNNGSRVRATSSLCWRRERCPAPGGHLGEGGGDAVE